MNYDKTLGSFILPDTIRPFLYTESLADFGHQRTISLCSAKLWRYRYSVMTRLIKHLPRKSEREKNSENWILSWVVFVVFSLTFAVLFQGDGRRRGGEGRGRGGGMDSGGWGEGGWVGG